MVPESVMRTLRGALVLLTLWSASSRGGILDELKTLNARYGGRLGVMAKNLVTGETVAYNSIERFPTASVIKLPVMAAYFDLAARKQVNPDARIVLTAADKKPGSGILQSMSDGATVTLRDAVTLMITISDNTGTNLVLDRLAPTHDARMKAVNDFLAAQGLTNTKILNRLYSWGTKQQTPESMRYGIGVTTCEDMVMLLEKLYARTLGDSVSCEAMIDILKQQFYADMIPRFLPAGECRNLSVAHKTGSLNEVKADVGLVLSDRTTFAIAVFVDKHPDHRDDIDNGAILLGAHVARAIWNHFTGMTGYDRGKVNTADVDWTQFPGGKWAIYRSPAAPYPHKDRINGMTQPDGTVYPYFPHYADSSILVFVPDGFKETAQGANVIVFFHGHRNDNLGAFEHYRMPEAMIAGRTNALLVIPQGPYRARDSFGGKMEDGGGFRRMVEDVLARMKEEKIVQTGSLARLIIAAFSGGFRPAGFSLDCGGLSDRVTHVFLFDALYGQHEYFRRWLLEGNGIIRAAYTRHLREQHAEFTTSIAAAGKRWSMTETTVEHEEVVQSFLPHWLEALPAEWKMTGELRQ